MDGVASRNDGAAKPGKTRWSGRLFAYTDRMVRKVKDGEDAMSWCCILVGIERIGEARGGLAES